MAASAAKWKVAYKIFDLHLEQDGTAVPKTLFHGVNGSRRLPLGRWIEAEIKPVTDGSRQTPYLSGFHAYPSLDAVKQWLHGAKNLDHRVVVRVHVSGLREKPKATRATILADRLRIPVEEWGNRVTARSLI